MIALSLPEWLLSLFLRLCVKPFLGPPFKPAFQRRLLQAIALVQLPPFSVRKARIKLGGVPTLVLAPKGVPLDGAPDKPVVLYLHGGAFIVGSPATHLALGGYFAHMLDGPVHMVDYRLAPEHPYPAGREDALAAYRGLIAHGIEPERIVVAGDSAGGVMATDLVLDLIEAGEPAPAGLVLLSAAFALDADRPAGVGRKDTFVSARWGDQAMELYGRPSEDGILRRDLSGLPRVHVQFSTDERMAQDSRDFVEAVKKAGGRPEVREDEGEFHVLALLPATMLRSRVAVNAMAAFSRRAVTLARARADRRVA